MYVALGLLLMFFLSVHGGMIQCFVGNYSFNKHILVSEINIIVYSNYEAVAVKYIIHYLFKLFILIFRRYYRKQLLW